MPVCLRFVGFLGFSSPVSILANEPAVTVAAAIFFLLEATCAAVRPRAACPTCLALAADVAAVVFNDAVGFLFATFVVGFSLFA